MQRVYCKNARPVSAEQLAELKDLGYNGKTPKFYRDALHILQDLKGIPTRKERRANDPNARQTEARVRAYKEVPYREYLCTDWWKKVRAAACRRADHRCQVCYSAGVLNVHHRTYERLGAEKDTDLTVLCRRCHELYHELIPQPKQ